MSLSISPLDTNILLGQMINKCSTREHKNKYNYVLCHYLTERMSLNRWAIVRVVNFNNIFKAIEGAIHFLVILHAPTLMHEL